MEQIDSYDRYTFRLLYIIHNNLSIDSLVEMGLEYSQIAKMLLWLFEEKWIIDTDNKGIILTPLGLENFVDYKKYLIIKDSNDWILPLDKDRIQKMDKYDIYLPTRDIIEEPDNKH